MVHTFEILYILERRSATYCAYRLNQHVNADERRDNRDVRRFLRTIHIRKKHEGLQFKGLRIPGLHQMDLVKYKDAPGLFFLYIMIEPEVLIKGENTLDVFYCSVPNLKELQNCYAKAIFTLFPRAFEGRPPISQVRYHDQQNVHPDEWKLGGLLNIPYLGLSYLSRIDFCVNYKVDNADLYVELIRKSYYSTRKKNIKFKNLNPYSEDRSNDALFYDKTSGFSIYNKYNKMMDPEKDNMYNIDQLREDAKDVIRIERPFYKVSKQKLFSLTGIIVPKAEEGLEAPLKMGPLPLLYTEEIGLRSIFKEYQQCVLGFKRNEWSDIYDHPSFKWVTCKRFKREMDRLYEAGRITKQRHDTVLKMAYATTEARSVKKAVQNCDAGTHVYWEQDDEGNKIRVPFQRSADNFRKTWQDMHELGMMLFRIPNDREVVGIENKEWEAKELDPYFVFDVENNMVGIGNMLEKEHTSHYDFLPYKVIRAYESDDPLEVQYNYEEITYIIYQRLEKYIDDSIKAYQERMRRRREAEQRH